MLGLNVVHLLKKKCIFLGKHIQPFIVCRTNFPERKVLRGHKILFPKRFETLMFHPRWRCKEALKRCAKKVGGKYPVRKGVVVSAIIGKEAPFCKQVVTTKLLPRTAFFFLSTFASR